MLLSIAEWALPIVISIIDKISLGLASKAHFYRSYNISSKIDGPKISMANRFARTGIGANTFTPGPGNYNTGSSIARPGSGATMGAKYGSSKLLN